MSFILNNKLKLTQKMTAPLHRTVNFNYIYIYITKYDVLLRYCNNEEKILNKFAQTKSFQAQTQYNLRA